MKVALQNAVDSEDYEAAADLRDACETIRSELNPREQFLIARLEDLQDDSNDTRTRAEAAASLAEVGTEELVAETISNQLATLHLDEDRAFAEILENSLWTLWLKAPEGRPDSLDLDAEMKRGVQAMAEPKMLPLAIKMFTSLMERAPSWAEAHNKRATCHYLTGNLDQAVADCKATLAINPHHFGCLSGLGMCLIRQNRFPEAKQTLEEAIRVNPTMAGIRATLDSLEKAIAENSEE